MKRLNSQQIFRMLCTNMLLLAQPNLTKKFRDLGKEKKEVIEVEVSKNREGSC